MTHVAGCLSLLIGLAACDHDLAQARVRVGTDLIPVVDFTAVVTTLESTEVRYPVAASDPFGAAVGDADDPGQLVAVFDDVSTREFTPVRVDLLDDQGDVVMTTSHEIRPDYRTAATNFFLYLDGLCVGVACPPERPVCTQGMCEPIEGP